MYEETFEPTSVSGVLTNTSVENLTKITNAWISHTDWYPIGGNRSTKSQARYVQSVYVGCGKLNVPR